MSGDREGHALTRWRLTWRERFRLLFAEDVYMTQLTFNRGYTPVTMEVGRPWWLALSGVQREAVPSSRQDR
jgi:hypothetical protein